MTMWNFIEIYWLDVLLNWAQKIYFFAIFLVPWWFLRSMGAVAQNWLILQKFQLNQNCRVPKSKIIMWHWFLALKARKAAKWPRTFYMVLTVFLRLLIWWWKEPLRQSKVKHCLEISLSQQCLWESLFISYHTIMQFICWKTFLYTLSSFILGWKFNLN